MRAARWLAAAAAFWSGAAAGHAGLLASVPPDGAALAAPPSTLELRFSEPVTPLEVRLFAGSAPTTLQAPKGTSDVVKLVLPGRLPEGLYTLSYRVISADSHPVGGSIVFGVGLAPPPRPAADGDGAWPAALSTSLRALRDLALLIAAGGALFAVGIARFPGERMILGGAGVAAIAFTGSFGLGAGGALVIVIATLLSGTTRIVLLLAGALAAIGSLPLTGHAQTARPAVLAMSALAVHALAAAFWVGSLAALLATVRMQAPVLRRFSRWGMAAVAVLVTGGAAFALLQIGSWSELWGSRYGLLIVAKVVLLAGLVILAGLNRWLWLPMLERGAPAAAGRLRGSIAAELALAGCVIAVTAVLVQSAPPRAKANGGFTHQLALKSDRAELSVQPARAGINTIVVRFLDRQGQPFDPDEVLLEIGNPAAGVEPAARPVRRVAPGHYTREGSELAFPGVWTIDVQARLEGAELASSRAQVPVRQ